MLHRIIIIVMLMLMQLVLLVGMVWRFNSYLGYFYGVSILLGIAIVMHILNGRRNPTYKLAWVMLRVFAPLM